MLEIIGTVFSHDVFGIPDVINDVIFEENIVVHFIDVQLIHPVEDAVDMDSKQIASGKQLAVVVRLFFDSFPLNVVAFEKEKYADEGNARQDNEGQDKLPNAHPDVRFI